MWDRKVERKVVVNATDEYQGGYNLHVITSYKYSTWRASKRTNARYPEGEGRWGFDVLANSALRVTPVLVAY